MRIELPSGAAAELVTPDEGVATRGLVVLPDIMGLRPLFDDHVARLSAATGWSVCAPEPWPGREHLTLEERLASVSSLTDAGMLGDAVAAAEATGCDTVGILGFCMGGMFSMKAAATGRFHRAVAFYGMIRVPDDWRSPAIAEPLDAVTAPGACPVLAIVGTADVWTQPDDIAALRGTGTEVVAYEGAEHGFVHDPERPSYRPDDAADAWRRALDFLRG